MRFSRQVRSDETLSRKLRKILFWCLEDYYNNNRHHGSLGFKTPNEYEKMMASGDEQKASIIEWRASCRYHASTPYLLR
jgi:hypothetical protein